MQTGVDLELWAKLGAASENEPLRLHPLVCHLLDAGHVAAVMWDKCLQGGLRGWMADAFGVQEDVFGRWASFWASLHDIGKATPTFQRKAQTASPGVYDALKARGYPFGGARPGDHGPLGKAILDRLFHDGVLTCGMEHPLTTNLAVVIAGHHGVFPLPHQTQGLRWSLGRGKWAAQQDALAKYLADHWQVAELPPLVEPSREQQAAYMALAGLVSVADWIASCEEFFPFTVAGVDVAAYSRQLPRKAEEALKRAGWITTAEPPRDRTFKECFGFPPYAMQEAVQKVAREVTGPSLIIVEAPTGMGKTEAAFQAHNDLIRRFGHRGGYLALPTQATSNQMLVRFRQYLEKTMPPGRANLQLLHAQAMLCPDFQAMKPSCTSDVPSDVAQVVAEEWFAASKRGLLAPFGVGTVDQGLLAILQTRGKKGTG